MHLQNVLRSSSSICQMYCKNETDLTENFGRKRKRLLQQITPRALLDRARLLPPPPAADATAHCLLAFCEQGGIMERCSIFREIRLNLFVSR